MVADVGFRVGLDFAVPLTVVADAEGSIEVVLCPSQILANDFYVAAVGVDVAAAAVFYFASFAVDDELSVCLVFRLLLLEDESDAFVVLTISLLK